MHKHLNICCHILGVVWFCDYISIFQLWSSSSTYGSVHPSVCPSHLFHYVSIIISTWNFHELLPLTEVMFMQKVEVRVQRSRSQRSKPNLAISRLLLQFEFANGDKMMHKAWCSIGELPHRLSRSSVKFQGHTGQNNADFNLVRNRTITPVWIHTWLWNDAQSLK